MVARDESDVPIAGWIDWSAAWSRNCSSYGLGASLQVILQLRRQLPQLANQMNELHPALPNGIFLSRRKYEHLSLLLEVSDSS